MAKEYIRHARQEKIHCLNSNIYLHFKVFDAKLLSKSEIALRILIFLLFAKTFLLASIHYFRCQKLITIVALHAWVYQANVGCGICIWLSSTCIWLSSTLPCTISDQIYVRLERNETILFYACYFIQIFQISKAKPYGD